MQGGSSILGRAVKRVEDPRFITGRGGYVPNRQVEGALHMVSVRSPVPHGRIVSIETDEALASPGVVGVYTAADIDTAPVPAPKRYAPAECARPAIASDIVRFVGEVVAVVVAESAREAADAADLVWVDIDPLPAVSDLFRALEPDAPLVFAELGTNVIYHREPEPQPDLFAAADVVVEGLLRNQRVAAVPLEANNAMALPTPDGIELWTGSQDVFNHRHHIARSLGMDKEQVRARVPDMGGGFGAKFRIYPEQILVAALARKLDRPVRWQETRRDNLAGMYQGRDQYQQVKMGATREGKIVGFKATVYQDTGAYPATGTWLPILTLRMACGVYDIPAVELELLSVATHKTPTDAYRGAGRPEATAMVERTIDLLATELAIDPAELRRRNFIGRDAFPVKTAAGALYDSGDYDAALDRALDMAGYARLREEQERRRRSGERRQLGIGVSAYVEITASRGDSEWSSVEVHEDGTATIKVGTISHGHGHETAFSQLISDLLQIPLGSIRFVQGDTGVIARGYGTGGSRSLQIGGSSLLASGRAVLEQARKIVAEHYEASPEDIVLSPGGLLGVAGVPDTGLAWGQVATLAKRASSPSADDETPALIGEGIFEQDEAAFPFGAHVSVVEVDTETGDVAALRHIAVDDCGTILNRILVDGQVHGGVAQGYGQALIEQVVHDADANPLTGTLVSYLIPTAGMLPSFEVAHTETPTPLNPLGAKGIGEAGTIGATPAVQNAVVDAVSHLGVRHIDMPATPANVWQAIARARAAAAKQA